MTFSIAKDDLKFDFSLSDPEQGIRNQEIRFKSLTDLSRLEISS